MSARLCLIFPNTKPVSAPTPAPGIPKIAAPSCLLKHKKQSEVGSAPETPIPAPMAAPTPAPIKVAFLAVIPLISWMLKMSSRLISNCLLRSENESAVSETLISFPLTLFPFFSFTSILLPAATILRPAQSLMASVASCANVTGGSANKTARTRMTADLFFLVNISYSFLPPYLRHGGQNEEKHFSHKFAHPIISGSAAHPCLHSSTSQTLPGSHRQGWAALSM